MQAEAWREDPDLDVGKVGSVASVASVNSLQSLLSEVVEEPLKPRRCEDVVLPVVVFCTAGLALFSVLGPWETAEETIFVVGDCLAILLLAFCIVVFRLERLRKAWRGRHAVATAFLVWLGSLLLSLRPGSRRRKLFGWEDDLADDYACEEASSVLWIGLLLGSGGALGSLSAEPLGLLGAAVALQHLFLGLVLDRPECKVSFAGFGGPLLGLSPVWSSTIQLLLLTLLFAIWQFRLDEIRCAEHALKNFLDRGGDSMEGLAGEAEENDRRNSEMLWRHWMESAVKDLEREEQNCRLLVREVAGMPAPMDGPGNTMSAVAEHISVVLGRISVLIKSGAEGGRHESERPQEVLMRAMEEMSREQNEAGVEAVSHRLKQAWNPRHHLQTSPSRNSQRGHTRHHSAGEAERRREQPLQTIIGLAFDVNLGEWNFDALGVEKNKGHVMQVVGFEFLRTFDFLPREQLCHFLGRLEGSYKDNPYHSHIHGADMCNSFMFLATRSGLLRHGDVPGFSRAAYIIAALGHDVGHFGKNNLFLINARHELAVTYNDRSVLENFHAASLARLLEEVPPKPGEAPSQDSSGKLLATLSTEQLNKVRLLMIQLILSTDAQKHLEDLSAFRMRLGASSFDPLGDPSDQLQTISILFRSADIGHSAKDWELHEEWSRRIVQEFHDQGDEEKRLGLKVSPLCDREGFVLPSSQVGFLQFVCIPTWKELTKLEEYLAKATSSRHLKSRNQLQIPGSPAGPRKDTSRRAHRDTGTTMTPSRIAASMPLGGFIASVTRRDSPTSTITASCSPPANVRSGDLSALNLETPKVGSSSEVSSNEKKRWASDICLVNAERNCQVWKRWAEGGLPQTPAHSHGKKLEVPALPGTGTDDA
mmetsp:Transcript_4008/g.9349  ORF Transcript_4008/g.9349 Transcript_4008/m.9349 type:complete len:876 (-) Transcript_4008:147-2774(-)